MLAAVEALQALCIVDWTKRSDTACIVQGKNDEAEMRTNAPDEPSRSISRRDEGRAAAIALVSSLGIDEESTLLILLVDGWTNVIMMIELASSDRCSLTMRQSS
jgi:hypothetical protein